LEVYNLFTVKKLIVVEFELRKVWVVESEFGLGLVGTRRGHLEEFVGEKNLSRQYAY